MTTIECGLPIGAECLYDLVGITNIDCPECFGDTPAEYTQSTSGEFIVPAQNAFWLNVIKSAQAKKCATDLFSLLASIRCASVKNLAADLFSIINLQFGSQNNDFYYLGNHFADDPELVDTNGKQFIVAKIIAAKDGNGSFCIHQIGLAKLFSTALNSYQDAYKKISIYDSKGNVLLSDFALLVECCNDYTVADLPTPICLPMQVDNQCATYYVAIDLKGYQYDSNGNLIDIPFEGSYIPNSNRLCCNCSEANNKFLNLIFGYDQYTNDIESHICTQKQGLDFSACSKYDCTQVSLGGFVFNIETCSPYANICQMISNPKNFAFKQNIINALLAKCRFELYRHFSLVATYKMLPIGEVETQLAIYDNEYKASLKGLKSSLTMPSSSPCFCEHKAAQEAARQDVNRKPMLMPTTKTGFVG